ncbi:hypothetical protein MBLNU457_4326t1 [Dothideomycetes sp. NU457]
MKVSSFTAALVSAAAFSTDVLAGPVVERRRVPDYDILAAKVATEIAKRAAPNAPDGYTPAPGNCPSTRPTVRQAGHLSQQETEWLNTRRGVTIPAMRTLFQQLNITGLDTNAYFDNHMSNTSDLPNIAIAASGGGYRALMNGAGAIAAFDSRTAHNSTAAGALGGLLQSSTYLAGLSGGSWLVGSLYVNNFTSIQSILNQDTPADNSGSLWQFGNSIFEGPDSNGIQLFGSIDYYSTIRNEVDGKNNAGYETTITDYWGRALSYQLVNATNGGPAYTFSSIAEQDFYTSGSVPMPILVSDGRKPGQLLVNGNSTVYEFNPWELGSWDPTTFAFAPLEYLGSNFTDGAIPDNEMCVRGFDNAGYVMGTSSTLFNQFLLQVNSTGLPSIVTDALSAILVRIGQDNDDIAYYEPNPFNGVNPQTSYIANETQLTLVDGGEDGQNIPLNPLIQPERNVDVVFAIDSSADTAAPDPAANWPNGTSLVATYNRQFLPIGNGTVFPSIPDQQTFVNLGLNNRPTFFGCDANNMTGQSPLIVYLPNAPYSYLSNVSTFDPAYNDSQRNAIINNGYNVATMGNGTEDERWPTCVGCAILSRSLGRTNTPIPDICNQCFERYCWNGTIDNTPRNYTPAMKLDSFVKTSAAPRGANGGSVAALAVAVMISLMVLV